MKQLTLSVAELQDWVSGDPVRDALLIKEAPIAPTSLMAFKRGDYKPSTRMIQCLRVVMERYPKGVPIQLPTDGPPEAA